LLQELNRDKKICFDNVNKVLYAVKTLKNSGGHLTDLKFDKQLYKDLNLLFITFTANDDFALSAETLEQLMFNYCDIINIDHSNFDYPLFYSNMQGLKNQIDVYRRKLPGRELQIGLIDTRKYTKFSL
jgi:hypothetical protein